MASAEPPRLEIPATTPVPLGSTPANPVYTVGMQEPSTGLQSIGTYLGLLVGPLGTAGLVIVFVIFMLLERDELRDRMISLLSRGKYTTTTRAINGAVNYVYARGSCDLSYRV